MCLGSAYRLPNRNEIVRKGRNLQIGRTTRNEWCITRIHAGVSNFFVFSINDLPEVLNLSGP